jgi:hypothetical protein
MKKNLPNFFAIFTVLALFLGSATHAVAATFDPSKPLVVTLRDSQDDLSLDEFHYLEKAVKKTFSSHGYEGEIEVKRWGANVDEGEQSLDVSLIAWREFIPNQLDCRLYTVATIGDEKSDLGVTVGESNRLAASSEDVRRKLRESAENSITKLIGKLTSEGLLQVETKENS